MKLLVEFGNEIKLYREKSEISQSTLSKLSGIGREQISRIENGQINATIETIYKLSKGLNITMSQLMNFDNRVFDLKLNNKNNSINPKPIVKWAGGKTQLISELKKLMPENYNNYYEPFIGGGALFFNIMPHKAIINDFNNELIAAYKVFQSKSEMKKLIKLLDEHEKKHSEDYYYEVRKQDRDEDFYKFSHVEKAARFIYLNKAGFNGLYRVNKKGQFNVPSSKKENINTYIDKNFCDIFEYFSNAEITILNEDFEDAVSTAKSGDFVYFDPPYDSFEESKSFTSYLKSGFAREEQLRLSKVFTRLSEKGVKVMLSNHNTKYINELYKDFNINIVLAKRMINSKGNGRGNVEEVIITNY